MSRWQPGFNVRRNYDPERPLVGRAANDPFMVNLERRRQAAAAQREANRQAAAAQREANRQAAAAHQAQRAAFQQQLAAQAEQQAAAQAEWEAGAPNRAAAEERMRELRRGRNAMVARELPGGLPPRRGESPLGQRNREVAVAERRIANRLVEAAQPAPGVFDRLKSWWRGEGGRKTAKRKNNKRKSRRNRRR
jgi:hypothetical protein